MSIKRCTRSSIRRGNRRPRGPTIKNRQVPTQAGAMGTQQEPAIVALAWAYVALRVLHTFIQLGNNVVALRLKVFVLSIIVLTAMLVTLLVGIL